MRYWLRLQHYLVCYSTRGLVRATIYLTNPRLFATPARRDRSASPLRDTQLNHPENRASGNGHLSTPLLWEIGVLFVRDVRDNDLEISRIVEKPANRLAGQEGGHGIFKILPMGGASIGVYPFNQYKPHEIPRFTGFSFSCSVVALRQIPRLT